MPLRTARARVYFMTVCPCLYGSPPEISSDRGQGTRDFRVRGGCGMTNLVTPMASAPYPVRRSGTGLGSGRRPPAHAKVNAG